MMRKFLPALLLLSFFSNLLPSCSSSEEEAPTEPVVEEKKEEPPPPPPKEEPKVVMGNPPVVIANNSNRVMRYIMQDTQVVSQPQQGATVVGTFYKGDSVMVAVQGEWAEIIPGRYIHVSVLSSQGIGRDRLANDWMTMQASNNYVSPTAVPPTTPVAPPAVVTPPLPTPVAPQQNPPLPTGVKELPKTSLNTDDKTGITTPSSTLPPLKIPQT